MDDENPNTVNLDLNLGPMDAPLTLIDLVTGPFPESVDGSGTVSLEDWLNVRMTHLRGVVRERRLRPPERPARVPRELRDSTVESLELLVNPSIGRYDDSPAILQPGQGSIAAEESDTEEVKICENCANRLEDEGMGEKDLEKGNGDEGSFFNCNICLDLSKDPVVTCCGHLFCWSCLYRWLNFNSEPKECPVCKGEVTINSLTPIYGQGNCTLKPEVDPSLKIPSRPKARRVESWRQTIERDAFGIPMEEIVHHFGSRFNQTSESAQAQTQNTENAQASPERSSYSIVNRILTSRGIHQEHNTGVTPDNAVHSTHASHNDSEVGESRRLSPRILRRSYSHRTRPISNLPSALSSAERIVESYFRNNPVERNDERDSVSSIAAVINSENQTVDTAIGIDSTVSVSTASSRRRNEASRASDMDSGDSRTPRRRRLN